MDDEIYGTGAVVGGNDLPPDDVNLDEPSSTEEPIEEGEEDS